MGGKIGNPQIRGKIAARSLPPSMLGVRSLVLDARGSFVLPPSKLEVMSRGRSVAAVHGVKSQLSIEGGGVSKPPQWILSHFSFPDFPPIYGLQFLIEMRQWLFKHRKRLFKKVFPLSDQFTLA